MTTAVKIPQPGAINHEIPSPDEEEQLLAKIVFGDTSDFQENIKNFDLELLLNEQEDEIAETYADGYRSGSEDDDEDVNPDLNRIQDDQLFFVDDGEMEVDEDVVVDESEPSEESSGELMGDDEDAWQDSDDEGVSVSIVTSNRSKKLRKSYQESQISGRDYIRRLRAQFEKIYPKPSWVDDVSDEEQADGNESDKENEQAVDGDMNALSKILGTLYEYKDISHRLLPPKTLDIVRLKDANVAHPSHSAIQSLSFHPYKPLLLTGGYDRTLRIYHIDGKTNHLVTSVHLRGTPVQTCCFYASPLGGFRDKPDVQRIFSGGRRRYMHSWDLSNALTHSSSLGAVAKIDKLSRMYGHEDTQRSFEKFKVAHFHNFNTNQTHGIILLQGNNGWINVLNGETGVWMTGCKINGVLTDFCIDYKPVSKDKFQTILIAANTYSEIWEFNLNDSGKIHRKWKDEGGVGVTKIQVGGGTNSDNIVTTRNGGVRANRWLAIGSESGYVNVYDRKSFSNNPRPVAALDQLTTTISSLTFSPDGQILCMASRAIKDALRLVHLPTCSVFSNWPTSGTPLGKVTAVSFSPHGEMLAVGNEQGKVRLWSLNHY
ncbi:hypothetical protein HG536_0F01870 [Torulaspora globosa]|uniref:Uncharacterized protein n=1 Tax=Torulaspora globosa TaxID=48254 RepID=A0A7G3ZK26_9SACH|nr:uncharacterized protein HG536_0F01870 [Torulaspora globosa]QLL33862.1 hypothetical protein HG536_0F01870 [Torulaspora globosa]